MCVWTGSVVLKTGSTLCGGSWRFGGVLVVTAVGVNEWLVVEAGDVK